MNPADYDELTLVEMEFDVADNGAAAYDTTDEVLASMLDIPGLPEAVELFVMEFNYDTF